MKVFPSAVLTKTTLYISAVLLVACFMGSALAQDSTDEVHIVPRVEPKALEASGSAPNVSLDTHTAPIKKKVDLVLVPVTITDQMDRLVTGLDKDNFQVF